ncbi:MAG: lysine--tRNA ligase [Candidatus Latescibacteria bacterium]|nr:lysine--tRNA ligase [Candidatus Latescibacterota bacterium]NIM20952.1 lysine--tRNA ligase [Candidatus Latescibacterota bacterium]NIM65087.1 lysine--tRNA ligase [Candidatus Latescibacterota bacterium]NIO01602.1 lysine--tRNA ligase [Candidatus Latescibacterota bacterium]NIO28119.1 lysine--tRNA ligase [Candidatus Latescibacterota bacterium]
MEGLDKLRRARIEKLNQLKAAGVNPYPYRFRGTHTIEQLIAAEKNLSENEMLVSTAGRVMSVRGHGATTFGHIADLNGTIQFYIRKDIVGKDAYKLFKLIEVGDIVGVEGTLFRTKTDELTIRAQKVEILTKTLRPLPEKWHGLTDKELRYRQRYVDLFMNPHIREVFIKRSKLIESMRQFLIGNGFLEVETPILQPLYGGASARPFVTYHNTLDMKLYLRIADELYLKRLLVGGLERVFEFAKDFRNEGIDRAHNPEFTMMECYAAYMDYLDFMDMVEEMMRVVAGDLAAGGVVTYKGHEIDFGKPWKRIRYFDAIKERTGRDFRRMSDDEIFEEAIELGLDVEKDTPSPAILDELFSELIEPELIEPTFVYDYPKALSPLAKDHRSDEGLVERFEPFVGGFEVGNAFSELNDPIEQRKRFEQQAALRARGDEEAQILDEDFLRALEYGMPPAAGLGIGIDRLVMIFTDSPSIRDVLFFPHMRPEEGPV